MLSLMKGALSPSTSYQDKLLYLTSLGLHHSIGSDKNAKNPTCVDSILHLVTSPNTRYLGLQLLELALQQNSDGVYSKGKWVVISYGIIKDSRSAVLEKIEACKILSMIIPHMATDSSFDDLQEELIKDIFPLFMKKIDENAEWSEGACICVKICLKTFPNSMSFYQGHLLNIILNQASKNLSSKAFEVLAECFCELPYCNKDNTAESVQKRWLELYCRVLKTIESIHIACFSYLNSDNEYERLEIDVNEFSFKEDDDDSDFLMAITKRVCRFVNLCKCLAKLLSVKSRYSVKVPIQQTLNCIVPVYTVCKKEKLISSEQAILCSFIAQMRLAGLVVIESLMLNCNLLKHAIIIKDLIKRSIESSDTNVSSETVSELRAAGWKLLSLWLEGFGRSVSKEIAGASDIIEEILNDISIDASDSLQVTNAHKSKKKANCKSFLKRKNQQKVCQAALNALESLLCTGAFDFPKGVLQEICNRIFKVCHTIHYSCDPMPFPYDDESCRETLYSIVQTIMLVLKPDEYQILQTGMKILAHIQKDPSFKVRKLSNKMSVIYRLQLYPKRPLPIYSGSKQRRPNVSNEMLKYPEWSSQEYVPDIKIDNVSAETSENVNSKAEQSFQSENEVEVHSEEYMEVETNYPEQVVENQCNGEEILEIQSSSQCQDDVESDDEEEEEDEERSYGDEEIAQEEPMEELYIPTSRKEQTSPPPVQINSETVQSITEPEYEELAPSVKAEENDLSSSNKDTCINGTSDAIHEEVPSSSTQVANENGVFGMDDDVDEEHVEEEEEENESYPADKKVDNYDPPAKKLKIETKDDPEIDEGKEAPRSPTIEEMKADFLELLPAIEDVKSGKVQLSTSS